MRDNSPGLRGDVAAKGSLKQVMNGARMILYSTAQAANSYTGVPAANTVATLTLNGAAWVGETRAQWKNTIAGAATGTLNALFMGYDVFTGTSDAAGSATTIKLFGGSATDDFYNGMFVYVSAGTGLGNVAQITDYVGSTKVATVSALNGVPFVSPNTDSVFHVVCGFDVLGAPVAYTTDAATTAALVVAQINANSSIPDMTAHNVSAGEFHIEALNGIGAAFNGKRLYAAVAGSLTDTITTLEAGAVGGPFVKGVAQSGGMVWSGVATDGQIPMLAGTWATGSGTTYGAAGSSSKAGTIASFRILVDPADDGSTTDSTFPRIDGNVGTLDTNDLKMGSTTRAQGDPISITTCPLGFKATSA